MIAKYSVKRPYTVLVAVILVIVLGVVSLMKMTTDLLPDMSFQYALIITTDVGASPEEVESDVTAPVEAAMATTKNIKGVRSISYNSYSLVICEYEQNANMDSVVIEIQQKLDQLESGWGDTVGNPMIMQINPDMLPIMMAAVDVDDMDQWEITNYVENELIPSLESVEGVASVSASGELKEHVKVTLDKDKIAALNKKIMSEIDAKFDDAQKELDDGKKKLEDGQKQLGSAGDKLGQAYQQVTGQKTQLSDAKKKLKEQLTQLKTQKEALEMVQSGINGFVSSDAYKLLQGLDSAVAYLDEQIEKLEKGEETPSDTPGTGENGESGEEETPEGETSGEETSGEEIPGEETSSETSSETPSDTPSETPSDTPAGGVTITELIKRLQQAGVDTSVIENIVASLQQNNINTLTAAGLKTIRNSLASQINTTNATIADQFKDMSAMGVEVKTYKDLATAAGTVSGFLAQINSGIAQMEAALDQIDAGEIAIGDAVDMINQNAALAAIQIAPGAAQMAVAAAGLEQAQSTLDSTRDTTKDQADVNEVLSVSTLSGLLVAQNFDMPAGYAKQDDEEYLIHVGTKVNSVEELEDLVLIDLGMDAVGAIHVKDIATVELVDNSKETYAIINGNPGLILSMEKQTGYSTGDVTDRILDRFKFLESENPALHSTVLMNQGVYIDLVLDSVLQNMIVGGLLAILVLILFLKDIKPTIIIACSIPLSVIFAVVLMYFTGISLNIISLSGLVLGIGMLVDNSIVVIENIYRLRGEGMSIRKAAVEGASQVTGAITASTLTTVSVYAPIIFTDGITRQLFVDLALTVAYTLFASLFVAMTLVPAMSSTMLAKTRDIKHPWFDAFSNWYGNILEKSLKVKPLVIIAVIVALVVSGMASYSKGLAFLDMDMDTGNVSVTISPKEEETLEFEELCAYSDEVMEKIGDIEGIDTIGATAGGGGTMGLLGGGGSSSSVSMYILLDPDAKVASADVAEQIEERTKDMGCQVSVSGSSNMDMTAAFGSGISIRVKGRELDKLQELATQIAAILEETEGTEKINDGLDKQTPQFSITVDKEKAAKYGYTVAQAFQLVMKKMASSTSATTIRTDIKDYQVYVEGVDQVDVTIDDIRNLTFTWKDRESGDEEEIRLADIADFEETTTLSTINRIGQTRYLTVSCSVDKDHNVSLLANEIQEKIDQMNIPAGYEAEMAGEDQTINDAMRQLLLMLLLAVIFIYLIMVAQFQSLLSPFIIMFTIPLAFTGGFISLFLADLEISVLAMLGFIMLAGVIVNNGIVLIDYINQRRREGMSKHDAIIDSGKTRLRPILMTALTTILAMSTSAMGMGQGAAMIKPMAITIVGGLVYGTVLTLIVIPCIYDIFNREKNMVDDEL